MPDTPHNRLRYYRSSLADGERMDIPVKTVKTKGRMIACLVPFPQDDLKALFHEVDSSQTTLAVLLAPLALATSARDGARSAPRTVFPYWIPANLSRVGILSPPEDTTTKPWLVRGVLAPNDHIAQEYPCLSTVDNVDDRATWAEFPTDDWEAYWGASHGYFKALVGTTWDDTEVDGWKNKTNRIAVVPADLKGLTEKIVSLYDYYLRLSLNELPPLLTALVSPQAPPNPITDPDLWTNRAAHLGQMGSRFPLSPSQRISLSLADKTTDGEVLAVNGPPGTGKTTLIQSIVADLVVKVFLERGRAPIIVGSSANNKALTNILDSFASIVPPPEQRTGLNERWLPSLESLGHHLAAAQNDGKEDENHVQRGKKHGYFVSNPGTGETDAYRDYCASQPKPMCEAFFLSKFRSSFGDRASRTIPGAVAGIRAKLLETVESINRVQGQLKCVAEFCSTLALGADDLKSIGEMAETHLKVLRTRRDAILNIVERHQLRRTKPWFLVRWFEATIHGPRTIRQARLMADLAEFPAWKHDSPSGDFDELSTEVWRLHDESSWTFSSVQQNWNVARIDWESLKSFMAAQGQPEISDPVTWQEQIQQRLDVTLRCEAFWYALHGIEGTWLVHRDDVAHAKLNKGKKDSGIRWQDKSFLTPVFVSTFHSLPGFFSYSKMNPQGQWDSPPLNDCIDLLVIDEAGQAAPELGIAAFGLARRAIVVGDVRQLEPIWSIPSESIDYSNALRSGLISQRDQYTTFLESKRGSLNGSLMHLAQNGSRFHFPVGWREPGSLLTEHRRCVPQIIEYCNRFVYEGLLNVKTESKTGAWPALGYCQVAGESREMAGSQVNQTEAQAIAVWVKQNADALCESQKGALSEVLAILTPFKAQKYMILRELKSQGVPTKDLVVGTVHALQGAEKPVILFSPVYGRNTKTSSLFFNKSYNMLNVAVSRAKNHFLVFGNMGLFKHVGSRSPASDLGSLLFEHPENELPNQFVFQTPEIEVFEQEPISRISDLGLHRASLRKAFETASARLVIVSPFISSAALTADAIPELVEKAVGRGVSVKVITDQFLDAPRGELRSSAAEGRALLTQAGAELIVRPGIHNKTVIIDQRTLIEGSFNWLSAVRDPTSPFCRMETSIVINQPAATKFIPRVEEELGLVL